MVTICGSTLINIGTLSRRWIEAMEKAAKKADALGKRWVLDPVGAGATPLRMQTCTELLKYHPTVIRGNASEIMALAGANARAAAWTPRTRRRRHWRLESPSLGNASASWAFQERWTT